MKTDAWAAGLANLPPEWKLLLLCSRYEPTESEQAQIRALIQSRPDWAALGRLLRKHRVYPIAYRNLKNAGCAGIDAEFLSSLERLCRQNQYQSLQNYAELLRLTGLFAAEGIRTLSIRGPVLSRLLYGDVSVRVSHDLDLLVPPGELDKAGQILEREGYGKEDRLNRPTDKQRAVLLKTYHHFKYVNRPKGLLIELHWCVTFDSYRFGFEDLWAMRTEVNLNGRTICALSGEENLLYLALHGSKHAFFRLQWLCDVQEIVRKNGLNWEIALQKARELGIEHMLAQALILSHRLFHTEPHAERFDPAAFRLASRLARAAVRFILCDAYGEGPPGRTMYFRSKRYMLASSVGAAQKLAFLKKRFYPNELDFERFRINDRFFALYYLLRPLSMFGRTVHAFGRRDGKG